MTYAFRTTPFSHQARDFNRSADLESFAVLWEQGTGKTKLAIDTAGKLFADHKIDAVLVVAPNGVHRNWATDEVPTHLPEDLLLFSRFHVWDSSKAANVSFQKSMTDTIKHEGLAWLMMSYDNFMTGKGKAYAKQFLLKRRCLFILDEAHNIKTPGAKRTKTFMAASKYAPYRRILTGTPVAQGPFDIYSQMKFIDNEIWVREFNISTFQVFKSTFAEWFTAADCQRLHGYDPGYDQLVGYRDLDKLNRVLDKYGSRVLKTDVLDLPPKLYSKLSVELTKEQQNLYRALKDDFTAEIESGEIIDASLAIVRLLRLQQIICGYIQAEPGAPILPIGKTNPRLDLAAEVLTGLSRQAIVWARFTEDIDQLMRALGDKAVRYDGRISDDEAERSKLKFKAGDAQFFVANQQKGATGLTLNEADTVLYYSNSFKLVDRLQSEDRCHRAGQTKSVQYIDLIARHTVDEHIVNCLREKLDIASAITGDALKEWL